MAAVAIWSLEQQSNPEPQRDTRSSHPVRRSRETVSDSAKGDLRTLFSADDYPADAQRNGEEGTVQVELAVDARGHVSGCRLLRSSGSATLDTVTCRILERRARFTPARDAAGKRVPDRAVSPPIVWRLEG
jgi:periplasmic protein TonB